MGKIAGLLRRAAAKPLPVIWFRARQATELEVIRRLNIWPAYERRANSRWQAPAPLPDASSPHRLIGPDGISAVRRHLENHPEPITRLSRAIEDVRRGRVKVFGVEYDFGEGAATVAQVDWPWHTDWRYAHRWPAAWYTTYRYYETDKPVPYDVKFPWELSRLGFLLAPSLWAATQKDTRWWGEVTDILDHWQASNPIAETICWNPMECSIRGVNLAHLAMIALSSGSAADGAARRLLTLCEIHGRFIYRNIEYTDVRGNHYAANLAALVMLGSLLQDQVAEARKWLRYGRKSTGREILLQYSADGVQFEKSIPYHRLVTELFVLAGLCLEKSGTPLDSGAQTRLRNASRYTAAYMRPDGRAPNWGDNDDATVLTFDPKELSDHTPLLGLAMAAFGDQIEGAASTLEAVLFGTKADSRVSRAMDHDNFSRDGLFAFEDGGMVIKRCNGNYLIVDTGEVGMFGRGGHGHLDALSFELMLGGEAIIIDPGSYVYTADLDARNHFRSSQAHNVLRLDDREPATLDPDQVWRLGAEGDPRDVQVCGMDGGCTVSAWHDGYAGPERSATVGRRFEFDAAGGNLTILDTIESVGGHEAERLFHLAPELKVDLGQNILSLVTLKGKAYHISWSSGAASLADGWISRTYGSRVPNKVLRIVDRISGSGQLKTEIYSLDQER